MPVPERHEGRFVVLTPLRPEEDMDELFAASHEAGAAADLWRYMPCGPFDDATFMRAWFTAWQAQPDVVAFAVNCARTRQKMGMISIMRITPRHGVAELGFIWYAPAAQRTKANTETVCLLLGHLFDTLHYRRVEWKCDNLNERSKTAALRLGFAEEGLFRQHMVVKGRNRDTAWFAMTDGDWARKKPNFERWLYSEGGVSLAELNRA